MADPVQDGLAVSLARPGGNITGTTLLGPELVPKRLALSRGVSSPIGMTFFQRQTSLK
jgi:putative tryptophan/tyrosine transport system substrate-binding protein